MGKAKSAAPPTTTSTRFRFFCWVVGFLSIAQLLVGLDYITIWPGAEAALLADASGQTPSSLVSALLQLVPIKHDLWLMWYRLPGVLLYVSGGILFYQWGKPLFGERTVVLSLLVAGGSLFLPVLAKQATVSSWVLGVELASWVAILRYFKQNDNTWRNRALLSGALAILLGSVHTYLLLLLLLLGLLYLVSKEQRNQLWQQLRTLVLGYSFVLMLSLVLASMWQGWLGWDRSFYIPLLSFTHLKFFGLSLLGVLPVLGFAIAGFRDLRYKAGRNEELSLLLTVALLASLLTQSLLFAFLLVFLAAKQLRAYFEQPNYPWQDWVKATMVLHLILVFIAVFLSLLGGFANFEAEGFRAVLGCSAAYWMFSFVAIIGLYGKRRDYVIGGTILAGVVSLLFFWVQVYPYLHLQRNWPERVVIALEKEGINEPVVFQNHDEANVEVLPPLRPYLLRQFGANALVPANETSHSIRASYITQDSSEVDGTPGAIIINGWSGLWEEVQISIE